MKIKDLADNELKSLAIKRALERSVEGASDFDEVLDMELAYAFMWESTKEGHDFWFHVNLTGCRPNGRDKEELLNKKENKSMEDRVEKIADGAKKILANKDGSVIVNFILGVAFLLSLSLLSTALTALILLSIVGLTLRFVFVNLPVKIYSMFKNVIKK